MKKMNKKAFTLIELLVVIAVVGILVLLAAPRFTGYTQKAEDARIQHDIKVMEQEVGTMLINGDDDFNKWENNSKDYLNQLAQDNELFEKEGPVANDKPIDGSYKVIPEEYKDKINTKLKGTFYANSDGKVYYEHGKSLFGIPTESEEEPGYSEEEIDDLVYRHEYIPVATAEELNSIRNGEERTYGKGTKWAGPYTGGLDKQYIQVAYIDLGGIGNFEPIGTDGSEFTGTFDGGDYVISNLTINRGTEDYIGLFGKAIGATFKNIGLVDVNVTGGNRTGGLVGRQDSSSVSNSYATGSVTGTGNFIGGLVGYQRNAATTNSYATGPVNGARNSVGGLVGHQYGSSTVTNSYATGSVTGKDFVGGLVGAQSVSSTVTNSYATGSVTGRDDTGGLVGFLSNSSTVTNSYATGSVTGTGTGTGGLAGRKSGSSTVITDSYYDKETTGQTASAGGTGKTTAEMKNKDTYVDWDFDTIWEIEDGQYPTLR